MIVSELISLLKQLPQDSLVLARGYESGYDAVTCIHAQLVAKTHNPASCDGDYTEDKYYASRSAPSAELTEVVSTSKDNLFNIEAIILV